MGTRELETFVRAYLRRPQGGRTVPIEGASGVTTFALNKRRIEDILARRKRLFVPTSDGPGSREAAG